MSVAKARLLECCAWWVPNGSYTPHPSGLYWVAVKELKLSYYIGETPIMVT